MDVPELRTPAIDRRRAMLAVVPLAALGTVNIAQLLVWGEHPLWALVIVPPILFFLVLAWLAFETGFAGGEQ